tara:strand:+ start:183 stop:425 length:243 start_codon:yes stop_codon:yes gene_type:complete
MNFLLFAYHTTTIIQSQFHDHFINQTQTMDVQPPPPPNPTSIVLMQKQMTTMMAAISNGMNVKVDDTADERLGGPQKCGR